MALLALLVPHQSISSVRETALSISAIGLLYILHPVGQIPPTPEVILRLMFSEAFQKSFHHY